MELRHLRYFIAVAEELHFGRAAKRLQISQPPLSYQIKQLETHLGVLLFKRTKQRVELTSAGKVFLMRAYEILNLIDLASDEAKRVHRGESGQLILGFTGAISFKLLPTILRNFQKRYPRIKLVLKQMTTTEQIQAFQNKMIHVGLVVLPVFNDAINVEFLYEEPFVVALPKSHPLALQNKKVIDIRDLKNEPFIMTPRSSGEGYYDSIISLCQASGFSPKKAQEAEELHTAVSFIASGMGVAILPSSIQFVKNDDIVYFPLKHEDTGSYYKTGVVWSKTETSPVVHSFVNFLKESLVPMLNVTKTQYNDESL